MDRLSRSKSMAKALRTALAERQVDLSHSACLEIVARQSGFDDWNLLKAACDAGAGLSLTVFVEHGRQEEAATFYRAAFNAALIQRHFHSGELIAVALRIGETSVSIAGANPQREREPGRGGPFFPKADGEVNALFRLEVVDAAAAYRQAIDAGARDRGGLGRTRDGQIAATVFDPFGHIWSLIDRAATTTRRAG